MLQYYYMTYLVATILGFVQGATEFIPISSSGHLIIFRELLGQNNEMGLAFDAVLQLATSFAVLVYFWGDVSGLVKSFFKFFTGSEVGQEDRTLLLSILIGTIPAVIFGLLLEEKMETIFRNTGLVSLALIFGSLLIYFAQKISIRGRTLSLKRGFIIGLFQCLALVPGISRSGATISGGLINGLSRETAVKFSFLLSLPILFGTGFKKLFDIKDSLGSEFGLELLLGSMTAFIVGLFAINFLVKYLKNNNLNIFIWYRVVLALIILLFF